MDIYQLGAKIKMMILAWLCRFKFTYHVDFHLILQNYPCNIYMYVFYTVYINDAYVHMDFPPSINIYLYIYFVWMHRQICFV